MSIFRARQREKKRTLKGLGFANDLPTNLVKPGSRTKEGKKEPVSRCIGKTWLGDIADGG